MLKDIQISPKLVLVLLLFITFVIYWNGLIDVPRRDQAGFLAEKTYFSSNFDWLIHTLSYNRTRLIGPGDYYLFRPVHMFLISVADIFFRDQPQISGGLSIIYLFLAASILFFLLRNILNDLVSFLFALLFIVQYVSQEIVLWRHISPYLLALFFWGLSLRSLLVHQKTNKNSTYTLGAFFLFIACCIHEMVAAAAIISVAGLIFFRTEIPFQQKKKFFVSIIAPPIVYIVLNILDFYCYSPGSILGVADKSIGFEPMQMLASIWGVHSASVAALIFPFTVTMQNGDSGILVWAFNSDSLTIKSGGVIGLLYIVYFVIQIKFRTILPRKHQTLVSHSNNDLNKNLGIVNSQIIFIFSLSAYLSFLISIGIGRVYLRSVGYLHEATYYYSFSAFFLLLMLASGCLFMNKQKKTLLVFMLSIIILLNGYKLHNSLDKYAISSGIWLNQKNSTQDFFRKNNNWCLVGFDSSYSKSTQLISYYLEKYSCSNYELNKDKSGVFILFDDKGEVAYYHLFPKIKINVTSQLEKYGPEELFRSQQASWHAEKPPKYPQAITVDFYGQREISLLGLLPQESKPERAPKAIRIETSNDGKSWLPVADADNVCTSNAAHGWHDEKFVQPAMARYLKITIFSNCGDPDFLTLRGLRIEDLPKDSSYWVGVDQLSDSQ